MKILFRIFFLLMSLNLFAQAKEEPVFVDREDGFYQVIDYSTRKSELKDLKLMPHAEISTKEIQEIKKSKDDLDRNVIDIVLTQAGAKKFKKLTKKNLGNPIPIVLNKKLISAPIVVNPIPDGKVQIIGNFTEEEIDDIIKAVKK